MKYFLYALCLSLIILKLTHFIDWSWWLVLLPIYGGAVLWILVFLLAFLFGIRTTSIKKFESNRKSRFQEKLDKYMEDQRRAK